MKRSVDRICPKIVPERNKATRKGGLITFKTNAIRLG